MVKCKACGTELATFEFQSRAADEAHTEITTCPHCPVNPNKLDIYTMPKPSFRGMVRPIRRSLPPVVKYMPSRDKGYMLSFEIPTGNELNSRDLMNKYIVYQMPIHKRSVSEQRSIATTKTYYSISGMFPNLCFEHAISIRIGMGIKMEIYDTFHSDPPTTNNVILKGEYTYLMRIMTYDCYVYSFYGDRKRYIVIPMGHIQPLPEAISMVVNKVYAMGILPQSISNYIGSAETTKVVNLSPRAWDASSPPSQGHMFTTKPDGQRMWLIWYGNIWYVCEPKGRGIIRKWKWSPTYNDTTQPIILDVEFLISYGFILIDFLTDVEGNASPIIRDIHWIKDQYYRLNYMCDDIPVSIREYFDNYNDAVEYCNKVTYPTDGIVAIRNGSTEILKLKEFKSVELMITADRSLVTAEGNVVSYLNDDIGLDAGSIVELRFKVCDDNKTIDVVDMFERPDKNFANSNNAVHNIISSGSKVTKPDDNERRVALLWCNDIRVKLVKSAIQLESTRSIIIDVGTGTGQSVDALPQIEGVSYVFIEPDMNRCRQIARKLKSKDILTDAHQLISKIRGLKTRSLKNVIINSTLESILENENVSKTLFSEARSIIATFSMHYVFEDLYTISDEYRVPVYGCMYTYDNISADGILIDSCGVMMKSNFDGTATVKWGGDKLYVEPMTMKRDYVGIGSIVPGGDILDLPDVNFTPGANAICKNIIVLMP